MNEQQRDFLQAVIWTARIVAGVILALGLAAIITTALLPDAGEAVTLVALLGITFAGFIIVNLVWLRKPRG